MKYDALGNVLENPSRSRRRREGIFTMRRAGKIIGMASVTGAPNRRKAKRSLRTAYGYGRGVRINPRKRRARNVTEAMRNIGRRALANKGADHFVQVRRGNKWVSLAAFFDKAAALDYGRALARKFKRATIRYFYPDEGKRFKKNPVELSASGEAAARRLERFTGHEARRARRVPIPTASAALEIGPCLLIGYETIRDGKREKYIHRFSTHAQPLLAASSDGRSLFMLGGAYRFTERGIVDKKR